MGGLKWALYLISTGFIGVGPRVWGNRTALTPVRTVNPILTPRGRLATFWLWGIELDGPVISTDLVVVRYIDKIYISCRDDRRWIRVNTK